MLPLLSSARVVQSRRDSDSLDLYGRCLQHAMWTIATAFSSQFENIRDRLYTKTRQMLDKLDLAEPYLDTRRVEPTQAWILIVFYELMKTNYHCAWLSAGRVFRHVQMAELYSVDRAMTPYTAGIEADPIISEEKRRCFWLAYCLDRIISVLETTPLTLGEEVVSFILMAGRIRNPRADHSLVPRSTPACLALILSFTAVSSHRSRSYLRSCRPESREDTLTSRNVSSRRPSMAERSYISKRQLWSRLIVVPLTTTWQGATGLSGC